GPMSRRGWLLFLTMGAIWGVPYMMIKVAVEYVTPASLVFLRCAIGAVLLVPIAAALGHLRAVLPRWRPLLVFAAVEVAMPWLLLSAAEQRLSSSLSGLLTAAVPLVGALLGWITGTDRLGPRRLAGLFIGLGGVAALVGLDLGGGTCRRCCRWPASSSGTRSGRSCSPATCPTSRASGWSRRRWQ